ncbi:tryptophan halogenase family protein [Kineosporia succinea]|uniref:Tryptophan halogenase n=1 Tax=Kineosporia succinea TaxID=84632 RepID=A0ABT9PAI5_9ACTN|nr:tryptophan halogenase family protein [Kineosporia succinea]MDP9829668.1 tryptophan halogenase [Kineosporia succinea]
MTEQIRRILIVGGGTAGWLSAAYLNRAFGEKVEITLVESPRIPRIGVGEATVPTLRTTFSFLGMEESDWMPKTQAAFKSAVRFNDWRKPAAGQSRHVYYHPFFTVPEPPVPYFEKPFHKRFGRGVSMAHFWLKAHLEGDTRVRDTFGDAGMALQHLCELNKAPKPLPGSEEADPGFRYAYHFDAALIAQYLAELAGSRGVRRVLADVRDVRVDEHGVIEHVVIEDGSVLTADLYLDCTGFRGLLINQALKEPFVSASEYLLCDSAVAMPAAHKPGDLAPYTSATARDNGWIWEIPLLDREGTGYVYSSRHTGPDEAEKHLRDYLGERAHDVEANHIRMRVGHNRRSWVGNCVAVGLSSCFVEPLESTTIALIEYQLALLVLHFPDRHDNELRRGRYNDLMVDAFEDLRDFIVMHYTLTDRDDTEFWTDVRKAPIPESLSRKFAEYARSVIIPDGSQLRLFETRSLWAILSGMGFPFTQAPPAVEMMDDAAAWEMLAQIDREREQYGRSLPGHREYLQSQRG